MINRPYSKVIIELRKDCNLDEIKELLSNKGETEIKIVIKIKIIKHYTHFRKIEN